MRLQPIALWLFLLVLFFYLIKVGESILMPLLIAIAIWYLIDALADGYHLLQFRQWQLPLTVCFFLSILTFLVFFWIFVQLISSNIDKVITVSPIYQANFEKLLLRLFALVGVEQLPNLANFKDSINIPQLISTLAISLTNLAGNTGIILLYVIFLFLEEKTFYQKLKVLLSAEPEQESTVERILCQIDEDIKTYIGVKTLMSILTAVISFFIMWGVGVDFAAFWAILIFFLNFIPNVGSIIATIFPSLLALVQFDTFYPFIIIISSLGTTQFLIGNFLEPKMMGSSLNLSPLVILFSLAIWGSLWGVVGMFLCVPIMVIVMIVFTYFPKTRPLAILLSENGYIRIRHKEKIAVMPK
ncbi:AI-2E family transporter [Beggiatoa leptomitoformis]|uniref:AI-2E family transporter n=1 Tax=Beggiatoa leptomitoformis TaxID=288004 RepID=A0A2N9YD25_9GAMM|nr:AI-2E family transporter [Beggiatoa leptomitoformis]ALG69212.1 AI-2E family transporter [Beggiatoa leptomitoformis]AUI68355.1 AI-2E family transporter [Beggiatoa leptomitoformis]